MNTTKWIQSLGAVALAVAGVLASRGAFADNGSCGTDEQPSFVCRGANWGGNCFVPGNNNYVITSTDSGGGKHMFVNRGDARWLCIEGLGRSKLGDVTFCSNHDSTADGSSVTDSTGDCNMSVTWVTNTY